MSAFSKKVIQILSHPEAEEGLYLENFITVHEDEEREALNCSEEEILDALQDLIDNGTVVVDYGDAGPDKPIFRLAQ